MATVHLSLMQEKNVGVLFFDSTKSFVAFSKFCRINATCIMAIHKKCHFSQASLWLQLCHFPSSLHSESGTVIKGSRRQTSEVSGETEC